MDIVAFKLFGDYAHFSKPETIYSSLTYPVPPKTTIMGFLGALIGEADYWKLSGIKYGVKINNPIEKKSFCFNGIKDALDKSMQLAKGYQDNSNKKQFYRELICNPSYTIYLILDDISEEHRALIKKNLKEHKSVYSLYLGINFCLADFKWIEVEEFKKIENEIALVDTIILAEQFRYDGTNHNQKLSTFRAACDVEPGRIFKDFRDFLAEENAKVKIGAKNNDNIYKVNNENVLFF